MRKKYTLQNSCFFG